MQLDTQDDASHVSVNERERGGRRLPLEVVGVEAEDGGAQSFALPSSCVTRGRASGTGRCARSSGVCLCEPGAEGWSELAGIVAAARRRQRGCGEQFLQPGGALGLGFGGKWIGGRGGLSRRGGGVNHSSIERELTTRIKQETPA